MQLGRGEEAKAELGFCPLLTADGVGFIRCMNASFIHSVFPEGLLFFTGPYPKCGWHTMPPLPSSTVLMALGSRSLEKGEETYRSQMRENTCVHQRHSVYILSVTELNPPSGMFSGGISGLP